MIKEIKEIIKCNDNKKVYATFRWVIYLLTWPRVANQQKNNVTTKSHWVGVIARSQLKKGKLIEF